MFELPEPTTDHRYIRSPALRTQGDRRRRVPVGSQLPTDTNCANVSPVSRYTVRGGLRRLREGQFRPLARAGTMVVPRPSSHATVRDVVNDQRLLAFATGARFAIGLSIGSIAVTIDREGWRPERFAAPARMACGGGVPAGRGLRYPHLPNRKYYINPVVDGGRPDAAEPHRADLPRLEVSSGSASWKCAGDHRR